MSLTPSYHIDVDPSRSLIRIVCVGFWDDATTIAFGAELQAATDNLVRVTGRPNDCLYLCDLSQSQIQSAAIMSRFEQFSATTGTQARRIAVIASAALQKMQIKRLAGSHDSFRIFLTGEEDAAEAWILTER